MNEIQRLAYLDAMGIDSFVSRQQLPGAAPTRRLCIVRSVSPTEPEPGPGLQTESQPDHQPEHQPGPGGAAAPAPDVTAPGLGRELRESLGQQGERPAAKPEAVSTDLPQSQGGAETTPLFSVAACYVGGYYWLEEIPKSRELGDRYLRLLVNLGVALGLEVGTPTAERFDWPMHFNRHLDQGMESARHAFEGFLRARLERFPVRGVILLGDVNTDLFSPGIFTGMETTATVSARQMLAQPELKLQAWRDLKRLTHTLA